MSPALPEPLRLVVNLTPVAESAMADSAALTGLSRTDVVNRALMYYHAIVSAKPGDALRPIEHEGVPGPEPMLLVDPKLRR